MAASVAPARCSSMESSHSFYENSNAEAGPSRHPKALVTDQQTSITALSSSLLRGLDLKALGRCRGPSQDIALVEDDVWEEMEEETPVVVDKKGKRPMRPKKYLCPREDCDKSFSKPAKLREHELSHTGERPHVCAECGASYIRASHLAAHARTHQPQEEKAFQCSHAGCGKRFWTAQHSSRHEKLHEVPLEYECPHCELAYAKHHQLRTHIASAHSPAGTKPFKCPHPGCTWSFATSQKLKVHAKTHDGARYMCSHDAHGEQGVVFGTWSALRNHIKVEHPPQCPFQECNGRTFKSNKNLREHLKVHAEHGDVMEMAVIQRREADEQGMEAEPTEEGLEKFEDSDDDDPRDPAYVPETETTPNRKRKRTESIAPGNVLDNNEVKKLRRTASDLSKEFGCSEDGCGKRFKTKRAVTVHHQTAHLNLRPFICPHAGCDKTYGHKHLLQRHISARHRSGSSTTATALQPTQPTSDAVPADAVDLLTGMHQVETALLEKKPLLCPSESVDSFSRCRHRFGRLYDLRRHIKKHHGLDVNEEEVRVMLKDANKGIKGNVSR